MHYITWLRVDALGDESVLIEKISGGNYAADAYGLGRSDAYSTTGTTKVYLNPLLSTSTATGGTDRWKKPATDSATIYGPTSYNPLTGEPNTIGDIVFFPGFDGPFKESQKY